MAGTDVAGTDVDGNEMAGKNLAGSECDAATNPRRVVLVAYDDFGFLDLVGPSDVLTTANQLAGRTLYQLSVAAHGRPDRVVAESGLRLGVDLDLADVVGPVDTVIVTGGLGYRAVTADPAAVAAIGRVAALAGRVCSVCTGSFVLAAAGVLDGRRATTHWAYADELRTANPGVEVVADELYVRHGPVVTAAGVAAGIDLALALVADDHGVALARAVSRRMVVYLHRAGGQSQFSERLATPEVVTDHGGGLDRVLAGVAADPSGDHSVPALAERAAMSRRHFARVFRARTGTTPGRWVERVRVDAARRHLEQPGTTVEQVATRSGFASVDTMRQAFGRVLGVSPRQYRANHLLGADADAEAGHDDQTTAVGDPSPVG
ncbi:MAG: GlxA family transcriptional regulator [Actinomycetota bacterium]|nr:GlxA family transcriptional regulator [Actinomycetota bacterium]